MTDAVIVSTARTPIGKAYRGALNATEGATLLGHAIGEAVARDDANGAGTRAHSIRGACGSVGAMAMSEAAARVEEAGKAASNGSALNIAILAALNIADEYLQMKGAKENVYSQLENRSEQLIHLINDIR